VDRRDFAGWVKRGKLSGCFAAANRTRGFAYGFPSLPIDVIAVDNRVKSTLISKLFPDLELSYIGV
jgi:hypothetical protein